VDDLCSFYFIPPCGRAKTRTPIFLSLLLCGLAVSITNERWPMQIPKTYELMSVRSIHVFLVAVLLFAKLQAAGRGFCAVGCGGPSGVAFENEPAVRVWVNVDPLNAQFRTVDGTAKAGVDYVERTGTLTVSPDSSEAFVDIPLIDNGLLDGTRYFTLNLINKSSGSSTELLVEIRDNELSGVVDPLFISDFPALPSSAQPLPDGRILIATDTTVSLIQRDGVVESSFDAALGADCLRVEDVRLLRDGRILTVASGCGFTRQLRAFQPSGALDWVFQPADSFSSLAAIQPDGKMLVTLTHTNGFPQALVRLNLDGSIDGSFRKYDRLGSISGVVVQSDGGILVNVVNANSQATLVRLNRDGSLDTAFTLAPGLSSVVRFVVQDDGKLLVDTYYTGGGWHLMRLGSNGTRDSSFLPRTGMSALLLRHDGRVIVWTDTDKLLQLNLDGSVDDSFIPDETLRGALFEQPDGRFLVTSMGCDGTGEVRRYDATGKAEWSAYLQAGSWPRWCLPDVSRLLPSETNSVWIFGDFSSVDGFPRHGLARLFTSLPDREFRVLTPSEFRQTDSVARIQVLRTGVTTSAASVAYQTVDDTARAGEHYQSLSGRLNFAPLEVSKELLVPLIATRGGSTPHGFKVVLSEPSAGCSVIARTPISLLPELRIATGSKLTASEAGGTIDLNGTQRGKWYYVQESEGLADWNWIGGALATSSNLKIKLPPGKSSIRFLRAVEQ